jgi:drug/metabolite transporter (DMT)-like permease
VYVIWGSTYLGIRIGVETIPPFLLAGSRSFSAGLALYCWLRLRGARAPTWGEWRRAVFAGAIMLAGGNGLVTWAETRVPSNLAALLIAGVPAYVALMEALRPGGVPPSRRTWFGVLLGAAGMALLVRPDPDALLESRWSGVLALLAAGWCWAFGSLYMRYRPMYPNAALSGAQQMLGGGALMLVVSWARGELASFELDAVSSRSLAALAYLTLFGSLIAFSAFNWLVGVTTSARLSTTAYVNPMVALLLGWLVLGETLEPISLMGAALLICAVAVMVRVARPLIEPVTSAPSPSIR